MKKAICQSLFLLVVAIAVPAGAVGDAYDFKLVMSQDKNLCPAITEVLSTEYNAIGIQDPPRHEWFVKWEPIRSLGEQFKDESIFRETDCHILRWAKFDIDNDGQSESVVKRSGCLGGILSDRLYIFQSEDPRKDIYQTFMKPTTLTNSLVGMIDYTGDTYELKKLPPFNWKPGRQRLHHVSGIVFVHPFTFNGVTYLDLHGLCCNEDQSAWHIIARYKEAKKSSEQLEDICYVVRQKG